jgi:hypothetical protein
MWFICRTQRERERERERDRERRVDKEQREIMEKHRQEIFTKEKYIDDKLCEFICVQEEECQLIYSNDCLNQNEKDCYFLFASKTKILLVKKVYNIEKELITKILKNTLDLSILSNTGLSFDTFLQIIKESMKYIYTPKNHLLFGLTIHEPKNKMYIITDRKIQIKINIVTENITTLFGVFLYK